MRSLPIYPNCFHWLAAGSQVSSIFNIWNYYACGTNSNSDTQETGWLFSKVSWRGHNLTATSRRHQIFTTSMILSNHNLVQYTYHFVYHGRNKPWLYRGKITRSDTICTCIPRCNDDLASHQTRSSLDNASRVVSSMNFTILWMWIFLSLQLDTLSLFSCVVYIVLCHLSLECSYTCQISVEKRGSNQYKRVRNVTELITHSLHPHSSLLIFISPTYS